MLSNCSLFEISSFVDERGSLSFIEQDLEIPFDIKRIYYLYDTKHKIVRGVHAHHKLEQIIIALTGKFEIKIDDGRDSKIIMLDKPNHGLYLSPMIWREVTPLEDGGVFLVLASRKYEETDYIHEYKEFLNYLDKI